MPEPAIIVIFGITGDLVRRKLFPALYNLEKANLLHKETVIVGVTRQNLTANEILDELSNSDVHYDEKFTDTMKQMLRVQTMNVTKAADYDKLLDTLNKIEDEKGLCLNRLYYLSIPPQVFGPIVRFLGEQGLNKSCQHGVAESRLLVEKPFGFDYHSAKELITETAKYFDEDQIFRIDHYLAKETVQNIVSFRTNNAIFESLWNKKNISRIDITAFEKIGIEGRTVFYEQIGALRDLIQSHLVQLMAIITMDLPESINSDDIHSSKLNLLKDVKRSTKSEVDDNSVRGQYESYKEEVNNPGSIVETYALVKLSIENERWEGVPIILRTGKKLSQKKTEVQVLFKHKDHEGAKQNSLTFRIDPTEGIDLELMVKKPGLDNELESVVMDFDYSTYFDSKLQPDAYERVLVDVVKGDRTLFTTSDEILVAWEIVDAILSKWSENGDSLLIYKNNSSGPTELPDWALDNYEG